MEKKKKSKNKHKTTIMIKNKEGNMPRETSKNLFLEEQILEKKYDKKKIV